jgi:hypothetical protein
MKYTVVWRQSALDDLAEIWLSELDRESVSLAANTVDRILLDDPQSKGDEFFGDWLLTVDRLDVTYTIVDADRIVRVLQVRWHS